jgi:hypothetical protein
MIWSWVKPIAAEAAKLARPARTIFDNWIDWVNYKANVNFYECLNYLLVYVAWGCGASGFKVSGLSLGWQDCGVLELKQACEEQV